MTPATKAIVLNNPNNPTGAVYSEKELRDIGRIAVEEDFFIVSDEMYEALVYGEADHISIAALSPDIYQRTITVSGLSKSYAMTGWRIGYTGSSTEIARIMGSIQSHQTSNPCSISQAAAIEALNGPQNAMATMKKEFEKRNSYICERVNNIPCLSAVKPEGAFYLFVNCAGLIGKKYKDREICSAADIADVLINDYLVAVIPCADFGFPDHMRLSYAISLNEISKGMDRIEQFVKDVLG